LKKSSFKILKILGFPALGVRVAFLKHHDALAGVAPKKITVIDFLIAIIFNFKKKKKKKKSFIKK
jgi:hypothetical protein